MSAFTKAGKEGKERGYRRGREREEGCGGKNIKCETDTRVTSREVTKSKK